MRFLQELFPAGSPTSPFVLPPMPKLSIGIIRISPQLSSATISLSISLGTLFFPPFLNPTSLLPPREKLTLACELFAKILGNALPISSAHPLNKSSKSARSTPACETPLAVPTIFSHPLTFSLARAKPPFAPAVLAIAPNTSSPLPKSLQPNPHS